MAETISVDEIVETFLRAINERDEASREKLLEAAVTDDFIFIGVVEQTQGREAFNALLGEILAANPQGNGEAMVRTTEIHAHHRWVHFGWAALQGAGGGVVTTPEGEEMTGWYVGQLSPDGRIEYIIVFLASGRNRDSKQEEHEKSEEQAGGEQEGGQATTSTEQAEQQRSTTTLGQLTSRHYLGTADQD
jgi:hypothetical protein